MEYLVRSTQCELIQAHVDLHVRTPVEEPSPPPLPPAEPVVRSKWELVDYDSDE